VAGKGAAGGEPIKSRCGSWICTVAISPPPP
jgi:hypothetical protein